MQENNEASIEKLLLQLHRLGTKRNGGKALMHYGISPIILELFDKFGHSERIIAINLQIIRYLKGNIYKLFNDGAGTYVLKSMYDFPNNKNVQSGGCYAIRALGSCRPNAQDFASDTYEVDIVLKKAMTQHKHVAEVQKAACSAIWCLTLFEDISELFWKKDMIQYVIQSLELHPNIPKVQEYGIQALKQCRVPYTLARLGAIKLVAEAMKTHSKTDYVLNPCFKAIRHLTLYKCNADMLEKLQVPRIICDILKNSLFGRNQNLQFNGLAATFHMSNWKFLRNMFVKARIGQLFSILILNTDVDSVKTTFPYCLKCIIKYCDEEANIRHFLGVKVHSNLILKAYQYLKKKKLVEVELIFEVLSKFCITLVGARQPIKAEVLTLLDQVEIKYPYEPVYSKSSALKQLLI